MEKILGFKFNEIGRITKVMVYNTIEGLNNNEIPEYTLDEIIKNQIEIEGIKVHSKNEIEISKEAFDKFKFKMDYLDSINTSKLKVVAIKTQQWVNTKARELEQSLYLFIDEVTVQLTNTPNNKLYNKLIELGFQEESKSNTSQNQQVTTFTAPLILIYALIKRSSIFKEFFLSYGIHLRAVKSLGNVEEIDYKPYGAKLGQNKPIVLTSTSYEDNLNAWKNKMKMLGLADDYEIESNYKLKSYTGKSTNPIIPPVRCIGSNCFKTVVIKKLALPDTVHTVNQFRADKLEEITLGLNTRYIDQWLINSSRVKKFNTKNLINDIYIPKAIKELYLNTAIYGLSSTLSTYIDMQPDKIILINGLNTTD